MPFFRNVFFAAAQNNALVLIEPALIEVLADGHKTAALHTVVVGDHGGFGWVASLITTTVEVDCTEPRWKVVSEYLYFSLRETAERIDKSNLYSHQWQNLPASSLAHKYRSFACSWPLPDPSQPAASFPDLWAAAAFAAEIIAEDIEESAKP